MTTEEIRTTFAGASVERCGELRTDQRKLESAFFHEQARFVGVWRQRCLVREGAAVRLTQAELAGLSPTLAETVFLGRQRDQFLFAVRIASEPPPELAGAGEFVELREVMHRLDAPDAELIAYARAMIDWQDRHAFCGLCGQPNDSAEGGFVMACTDRACGHRCFPRLDPAIIVLVHRGPHCLLGRQPTWPEGRFSTIAGFVEPGESLEDAVRREVREETNVRVGACRYLASQPWPFPSALMIGFHATAESEDLRCNDAELAEARWLTREQIAAREVTLPPATSVAFKLIETWFDDRDGPGLSELGLAGPPLRVKPKTARAAKA